MILCSPSCGLRPDSGSGGERYEAEVLRGLVEAGDHPHILLAHGKHAAASLKPFVEWLPVGRGLRWWVMPWIMPRFIRACWRNHGFQLLRAHSVRFLGPACLIAKRRWGLPVPVVVHLHHWEPTRLTAPLERWVLRQADMIVADSQFAAGQAVAQGARAERIRVVYCGTHPVDRPPEPPGDLLERYGLARGRPLLLAVGPVIARKDPSFLVRLIRWGCWPKNVQLLWVGEGPLRHAMHTLASGLGVASRVRFPGYVPEADKLALFSVAQCFVHASRLEGFPLAVLEAMAAGLPVVAWRAASLPELVQSSVTGWLADTPLQFEQAVVSVLSNSVRSQQMGQAGATMVTRRFQWRHTVTEMREVYREAIQ